MVLILAKKSRGKNLLGRYFQENPSMVHLAPILTDDVAGFEHGASITGIRAEAFRKRTRSLGYALFASGLVH